MTRAPDPSLPGLVIEAAPLLACAVVMGARGLGQVRPLLIATARMVAQLALLGIVLRWVFAADNPWIVGAIALVMLLVSAHAVGSRQVGSPWEVRLQALGSIAVGVAVALAIATRLALRVEPWYDPRTILPLLGMVLGNSVNGVALAADRLEGELRADREAVELRLALGASAMQAALPARKAAVRAALTPTINGMMIAGIVAIPGMATGQILAGADVGTALRYQILVYLAITGTVATSTLILLSLRLRRYFTPAQQLRLDRLSDARG